uniref:Uncharacterized protein n=1 Tax=Parascaris equorum TaxID=6256 RepID=A0A914RG88_PAREQ
MCIYCSERSFSIQKLLLFLNIGMSGWCGQNGTVFYNNLGIFKRSWSVRRYICQCKHAWQDFSSADFYDEAEQTTAWMASIQLCDQLLSTRKAEFNELVAEKFDTVIVDDLYNPCGLLHTGLQKSSYENFLYLWLNGLKKYVFPPPPLFYLRLTDELNFWQRTFNMASYLRAIYVHQHLILRRMDNVFQTAVEIVGVLSIDAVIWFVGSGCFYCQIFANLMSF